MMEINSFSMEDLLLSAIKSEEESENIYLKLAERVENFILKERLTFLAKEEKKHKGILYNIYKDMFKKEPEVPEESPVPLPRIILKEGMEISEILSQAMEAEKTAADFYKRISEKFEDEKRKKLLKYFANMEMGHYKLLETERESAEYFEDYEKDWPMMHMGA